MNLDIALLLFIWKNRKKSNFFSVKINKISKSGNQRECTVYIHKNRQLIDITQIISKISGLKYNNGSVIINGCNMDMIFTMLSEFLDTLADFLYNTKKIRKVQRGFCCHSSNYYILL